jgi:hypothetical protein
MKESVEPPALSHLFFNNRFNFLSFYDTFISLMMAEFNGNNED